MCSNIQEPENGYITPRQKSYEPGDVLEIACQLGYELVSNGKLECLENGNWSTIVPSCTNSSTNVEITNTMFHENEKSEN